MVGSGDWVLAVRNGNLKALILLHSEWDTVFLRCSWDSKEGEVLFISILTSPPHLRE